MSINKPISVAAKAFALSAAVLSISSAQAALTNVTLDSGLQVSQDAATGLLWRSFDNTADGVQAGFRQATVADFAQLLGGSGYAATGTLPYALANPVVITPAKTVTTTAAVFATADGSALPDAFVAQQATYQAMYDQAMARRASGHATPSLAAMTDAQVYDNYYVQPLSIYAEEYGLTYTMQTTTTVIPAVTQPGPSLVAGGVSASYYTGGDPQAIPKVAGVHEYDNSYPFAIERHETFMGQLASDDGFWVGAVTYNYVPHQCVPGDAGYVPSSNNVQYCGGRASAVAYVGPSANTEYSLSMFRRTDYLDGTKPVGYLMVQAVPEPATYALMGLGLVGLAGARRRQLAKR